MVITESFWVRSDSKITLEIWCFVGFLRSSVHSGSMTLLTQWSTRSSLFVCGEVYHQTFCKSSMLKEADVLIVSTFCYGQYSKPVLAFGTERVKEYDNKDFQLR